MTIKPASARALTWLAAIVLSVGCLVNSPSGACVAFVVAAIAAIVPALFGSGKIRLAAAVLGLIALGLTVRNYPDFIREQERYRTYRTP